MYALWGSLGYPYCRNHEFCEEIEILKLVRSSFFGIFYGKCLQGQRILGFIYRLDFLEFRYQFLFNFELIQHCGFVWFEDRLSNQFWMNLQFHLNHFAYFFSYYYQFLLNLLNFLSDFFCLIILFNHFDYNQFLYSLFFYLISLLLVHF